MTISVLDPTDEQTPSNRTRAQRITSLEGATIGLLDISKPRGDIFLPVNLVSDKTNVAEV